jgi:hypothetical protein
MVRFDYADSANASVARVDGFLEISAGHGMAKRKVMVEVPRYW